jgi:hypothetical protein
MNQPTMRDLYRELAERKAADNARAVAWRPVRLSNGNTVYEAVFW